MSLSGLAPWIAPAVLSLFVKIVLLVQAGICFQCFHLAGQNLGDKLSEISFFRLDLLAVLLIVPAGLLLVGSRLPPRVRPWFVGGVSALAYLWLFIELQSLRSVGMFVSLGLIRDAMVWGWENPHRTDAYVGLRDLGLLAAGFVWVAGAAWWSAARAGLQAARDRPLRSRRGVAVSALALAAVLVLPWLPQLPVTPYHRSALAWAFLPWRGGADLPRYDFSGTSEAELTQAYRALSRSPEVVRDERYFGAMAGADVLFFVFETGPAAAMAVDGDLSGFPSVRRLRERAFIAPQHLTTAPLTNQAWISMFSSWYPSLPFDRLFEGESTLPGVFSRAAEAGYDTVLFSRTDPDRLVPGDEDRLRAMGFNDVRFPPRGTAPILDLEAEIASERLAVDLLKEDVAAWAGSGRRFAAAFFPIVGHAPWPDATGGRARTLMERGRALMRLQDEWLGEIVDTLERYGRLDQTVIVVTADHGIRTRKEDPSFAIGMIDEVTFHVPLLISAPRALASTASVPFVTSHVDIAPTVLDLLGIERDRSGEQGVPLWTPGLAGRVTFQPASLYLGSDGLARDGRFFMYSYLTDRAFEGPRMRFVPDNEVRRDSESAREAIDVLQRFRALQAEWAVVRPGVR